VTPLKKRPAQVVGVEPLGPSIGRLDLEGEDIGAGVVAGRFAMVEAVGRPDCILLRPFSYFGADGPHRISFLLKDIGAGTGALLRARPGTTVQVLGPLGSTYPAPQGEVWAVAGGVGAAPFGLVPKELPWKVLFGARTQQEAGFARALQQRGATVQLATDDGSAGFHGSVLALLEEQLDSCAPPQALYTCGPTAMMAAVAQLARQRSLVCYASLEERMGCGIGICRGCAHRDAQGGWRCICVDGPVYNAAEIFV
jgi:dihydroorotate dehydrogenase electron transfer subunit